MAINALAEEVAENLEEVAEVTRRINTQGITLFLGGLGVGIAVGFYFGYRFNKEKIRAEAFRESDEEIRKIRETYAQKVVAAQDKPSVQKLIEERGYSTKVTDEERERPLPAPVPIHETTTSPNTGDFSVAEEWDYPRELAKRTSEEPYVIHQNEFKESETEYSQVSYIFYVGDDVLVGEDERPPPHADLVVGEGNLKFGYGTDDENVVYVRNENLKLEMEITRSASSYEEEVLGMDRVEESE